MISFNDHFVQDDFYHTAAYEMTDTQFKVKCKCKKGYHVFGNGGDALTNRTEYRSRHCLRQGDTDGRDLAIRITKQTVRKLKSTSK